MRFYCFKKSTDSDFRIEPSDCVDCEFRKDRCRNVVRYLHIINTEDELIEYDKLPAEFHIVIKSKFVPIARALFQKVYRSPEIYKREEVIKIYNDMAFKYYRSELPYEEYADYQI